MADLILHGQFINATDLDGETGLTVTIDVYRTTISDGTTSQVVTDGACSETGGGIYRYRLASADPTTYHYVANMKTSSADVAQKHVAALGLVVPDALVSAAPITGDLTATMKTSVAAATWNAVAASYATAGTFGALVGGIATIATTLQNRLGAWTGTGVNTVLGAFKAALSKTASVPSDIGGTFDPAADSTEAISEAVATVDSDVWSYATRTLTQSSTSTTDSTAAGSIARRRGDSWSISLTIGAITGYTSLWFTAKWDRDNTDAQSVLQIKKNASETDDGLLYVNGAAATDATKGSITVSDASTGAIVIAVDETITDDLPPAGIYYDVQALVSGTVSTLDSGTLTISADVTRAVA